MIHTQFSSHTLLNYLRKKQLLFVEKKNNNNKMGMKQQTKINTQSSDLTSIR